MSRRSKGAVSWHLPKPDGTFKARAFAHTPQATADLIRDLAIEGYSWTELKHAIIFDKEAQAIAQAFIDAGFGAVAASTHVATELPEVSHG